MLDLSILGVDDLDPHPSPLVELLPVEVVDRVRRQLEQRRAVPSGHLHALDVEPDQLRKLHRRIEPQLVLADLDGCPTFRRSATSRLEHHGLVVPDEITSSRLDILGTRVRPVTADGRDVARLTCSTRSSIGSLLRARSSSRMRGAVSYTHLTL